MTWIYPINNADHKRHWCRKRSVILTQYIWRSFVSNIDTIRSLYHLTRSSCSDFSTALKGRHRFRSIRHLSSTHPPKPAVNQGSDTYDSLLQGQQKLDYKIQFNFITVCRATSVSGWLCLILRWVASEVGIFQLCGKIRIYVILYETANIRLPRLNSKMGHFRSRRRGIFQLRGNQDRL